MATRAVQGKNVSIYVDGMNASEFLNEFEVDSQRDDTDVTPFESDSKIFITSAAENDVTLTGFYNGDIDALDTLLMATYGGTVDNVITIFPGGTAALGKTCLLVPGTQVSMNVSAASDEQVQSEAQFKSSLVPGRVLKGPQAVSASGNGTAVISTATTSLGLTANLHVLTLTGTPTSTAIVVEGSPDGTVWTPILTFNVTAPGGMTKATLKTDTIPLQLRAKHTITGGTTPSLNYVLTAGRIAV